MTATFKTRPCSLCTSENYTKAPLTTQKFDDGRAAVFICKTCGMTPLFNTYESRYREIMMDEYYNCDMYSAKRSTGEYERRLDERLDSLEAMTTLKGKTLFDIGCGEGILMSMAKARGAKASGLEPDGSEVVKLTKDGYEVFEGLLEDLPMDKHEGQYDIVTLTWVLDAMREPVEELRRCRKLLKPDGILHISVSSHYLTPIFRPNWLKNKKFPTIWHKPLKSMIGDKFTADIHPFYFTRTSLQACLKHVGFDVEFMTGKDRHDIYLNAKPAEPQPIASLTTQSVLPLQLYFMKIGIFDRVMRKPYQGFIDFCMALKNRPAPARKSA